MTRLTLIMLAFGTAIYAQTSGAISGAGSRRHRRGRSGSRSHSYSHRRQPAFSDKRFGGPVRGIRGASFLRNLASVSKVSEAARKGSGIPRLDARNVCGRGPESRSGGIFVVG